MRNLKKFLALVLAMMMAFSLMVTVNASSFTDDGSITNAYTEAVDVLTELGVIKGYDNNGVKTFDPKANITRAEVAAIVYRLVTGDVADANIHLYDGYSEFTDVAAGLWYVPYINFCANNGLVNGVGNNRFAPKDNVTGYEALVMILRAIGYNNPSEFSNSDWKFKASGYGSRLGITNNVPAGSLGAPATREMVTEIMFQGLLVPTVSYSPLTMYTENVLVAAGTKGDDGEGNEVIVYPNSVKSTLMYETFKIVGKEDTLTRDEYGRPSVRWVKDAIGDKLADGTLYVVNQNDGTYDNENNAADSKAFVIAMTPVKTYYTAKTECDVSKEVNNDKSLKNVSEWLNGKQVKYGDDGGDPILTTTLDALHTTVDTIGAQGRTTEIYKVGTDGNGDAVWNIVYFDTLMGVVTDVTKRTFDTNGHTYHPASLTVEINDNVEVVDYDYAADYNYKVGDLVLLTTWGGYDLAEDGALPATKLKDYVDGSTHSALQAKTNVPSVEADFKAEQLNDDGDAIVAGWAVDIVGAPTSTEITVKATTGAAEQKTGLVSTDDVTYPASNVYCAEASVVAGYTAGAYVPADYSILMTNNLIRRTFTLYRDENGNTVGMDEATASSGIGVITELEQVRVGTGKWVMEMEIFHADNTSETLRFLTWNDTTEKFGYLDTSENDVGVDEKDQDTAGTNNACWNRLIKYEPVTLDGQTYYGVVEAAEIRTDNTAPAATGIMVQAGVADTLRGDGATTTVLNDSSKIIIASTVFDYSIVDGENTGAQVLGSLKGYTGFRTIPTIMGNDDSVKFQVIGGTYYVYPSLTIDDEKELRVIADEVQYGFTAQPTIAVDESYLVLSTVATYADHATYRVIKNGEITNLDVANVNNANDSKGLNQMIEAAMANNELISVLSKDLNGFATAITYVDQDHNLGKCDNDSGALTSFDQAPMLNYLDQSSIDSSKRTAVIPEHQGVDNDINVAYRSGVITLSASGIDPAYLTVAENCRVQIVNVATGNVYDATMENVEQYRKTASGANISELVYEVDSLGYVCNIYIID